MDSCTLLCPADLNHGLVVTAPVEHQKSQPGARIIRDRNYEAKGTYRAVISVIGHKSYNSLITTRCKRQKAETIVRTNKILYSKVSRL